jgi:surface protein
MKETIIASNETLKSLIKREIEQHGNQCDLNHIDVSNVTNMSGIFSYSKFNGDISNWNTANVTDMSWVFSYSKFNSDISQWNTANVTNMSSMFSYSQFTGDISQWTNKP